MDSHQSRKSQLFGGGEVSSFQFILDVFLTNPTSSVCKGTTSFNAGDSNSRKPFTLHRLCVWPGRWNRRNGCNEQFSPKKSPLSRINCYSGGYMILVASGRRCSTRKDGVADTVESSSSFTLNTVKRGYR